MPYLIRLAYRLLRICSKPEWFKIRLVELKNDLLSRNYNPKVIQDAFKRIEAVTREKALLRVEKKASEREPLVVTYHPSLPSLSKIVRKHHRVMIKSSSKLKRCFKAPSLIAYRRSPNLRDILIQAKLPKRKTSRKTGGFYPCGRFCALCQVSGKHTTHQNLVTGQVWSINRRIDCLTTNVVYKITCRKCAFFLYIGMTSRRFCDRVQEHRSYIYAALSGKAIEQPTGVHFSQNGHDARDMLAVAIEEVIPKNDIRILEQREKYWIMKYEAVEFGANSRS